MSGRNRVYITTGLVVAVALGLIWELAPLPDAEARLQTLPMKGPSFIGKDQPLSASEERHLKNVGVIKRRYRVGLQTVSLIVLDGTRDRHAIHDPVYCFRGDGWQVLDQHDQPLPGGGWGQVVTLEKAGKQLQALYFFSNGNFVHGSPTRYWFQATLRRITLGYFSDEPLLVILYCPANRNPDWTQILQECPQLEFLDSNNVPEA